MKRLVKIGLIAILLAAFVGCQSADDPGYVWLLSFGADGSGPTTAPPSDTDFNFDVNDVAGDPEFVFDTVQTVGVFIYVRDSVEPLPIEGTLVQIDELTGDQSGQVIFRALTDSEGNITGSFTVNDTTSVVRVTVVYQGQTYYFDVNITGVAELRRTIYMTADITPADPPVVDSDGDGIPDDQDQFPDDPTRATTVRYPTTGHYSIAYEDLYPVQGDADFNDFVIHAYHEEDLNAQGQVARIRGNYLHVAKGAGYNHTLNVNMPVYDNAAVQIKRTGPDGTVISDVNSNVDGLQGLQLMPRSDTTIPVSNTDRNGVYQPGDRFEFEIIPDHAVNKLDLGAPPYDLYLHVIKSLKSIDRALVSVTSIDVHSEAGGWDRVVDYGASPLEFDLIALHEGRGIELLNMALQPGNYTQVRLNLAPENKIIVNGVEKTLKVPSGEIALVRPFKVTTDGAVTLYVNFDLDKSLVKAGGNYIFKPTIKVLDSETVAGDSRVFINLRPDPDCEIHFAGRFFNEDGTDRYLDPDGFPWALQIPDNWKWLYERENIHNGYGFFDDWYMSDGETNKDWYSYPDLNYVFPFAE